MPYAQKNYLEVQGIKGKYRIDQIGCFLTSFSNLLERFGSPVTPVQLNKVFKDRNIFIDVDDGIRDDLGWQSVTAYNGRIIVSRTGLNSWPTSNNAIVKFHYKGKSGFTTHFCLVKDAAHHLIVDSYDGQVKNGQTKFGTPLAWAEYTHNTPQPVTPPAPKPAPAPAPAQTTNPNYDGEYITVLQGWGISHALKAAGYPKDAYSSAAEWDRVAKLNGKQSAAEFKLTPGSRIRVGKYVAPAPAPEAPAPAEVPVAVETPPVETPAPVDTPVDWKATEEVELADYKSINDKPLTIIDFEHKDNPPTTLKSGLIVHGASLFRKDDVLYVRTRKSAESGWWYGVPYTALEKLTQTAPAAAADDDSDIPDLNAVKEIRELLNDLTLRQKLLRFAGRVSVLLSKVLLPFANKNK